MKTRRPRSSSRYPCQHLPRPPRIFYAPLRVQVPAPLKSATRPCRSHPITGSPVPRTPPAMADFLYSFPHLTSSLSPSPTQMAHTRSPPRQRRAVPQSYLHPQTCPLPLLHIIMHQRLPRQTLRLRHLKRQDVDDRDTPGNNNTSIPMHQHRLHRTWNPARVSVTMQA